MLRVAALLFFLNYSHCADPSPCTNTMITTDEEINPNINIRQDIVYRCDESPVTDNKSSQTPNVGTTKSCGIRNIGGIGVRILGSKKMNEADYAEFPWTVSIFTTQQTILTKADVYVCGGSLIHPSVVVTAAHSVHGKDNLKIRAGQWDINAVTEMYPIQTINVARVVIHEQYQRGGVFNDIALLFLEKPVKIAPNVNVICLPPQDHSYDLQRCFATGWGKNAFGGEGKYQNILKLVELPIVPRDKCQIQLRTTSLGPNYNLHSSAICAGGKVGADTCEGDGGSPLFCPMPNSPAQPETYSLAGIVSWGVGCGDEVPGIYVNVPLFRDWIDTKLPL